VRGQQSKRESGGGQRRQEGGDAGRVGSSDKDGEGYLHLILTKPETDLLQVKRV